MLCLLQSLSWWPFTEGFSHTSRGPSRCVVTMLSILEADAAPPGLPGHHIEATQRLQLDAKKMVLFRNRGEAAREFGHFNKRFRNRFKWQMGKIRHLAMAELTLGLCVRHTVDSSLFECTVDGSVKAMARMHTGATSTRALWHEVAIWSALSHPCIVGLVGISLHGTCPLTVSEYCEEGSLFEANRRQLRLLMDSPTDVQTAVIGGRPAAERRAEVLLAAWSGQVAAAMAYLHGLAVPVCHRNLKSSNVMLADGGSRLRVTDFTTACLANEDMTPAVGSARWMAPEILNDQAYAPACDVYSFAMLCYEMVSYMLPFASSTSAQAALKAAAGARPSLPNECSEFMIQLITTCWQQEPASRPDFQRISAYCDEHKRKLLHELRTSFVQPQQAQPLPIATATYASHATAMHAKLMTTAPVPAIPLSSSTVTYKATGLLSHLAARHLTGVRGGGLFFNSPPRL